MLNIDSVSHIDVVYKRDEKEFYEFRGTDKLITGKPHTYVMDGYVMRVNLDTGQFYSSTV